METVKGVEGWVKIEGPKHDGQSIGQHGNSDHHLSAPLLKRKKALIRGGGGGSGKERIKNCPRISRMARYSWDGEDRGVGDNLSGSRPTNYYKKSWGRPE